MRQTTYAYPIILIGVLLVLSGINGCRGVAKSKFNHRDEWGYEVKIAQTGQKGAIIKKHGKFTKYTWDQLREEFPEKVELINGIQDGQSQEAADRANRGIGLFFAGAALLVVGFILVNIGGTKNETTS